MSLRLFAARSAPPVCSAALLLALASGAMAASSEAQGGFEEYFQQGQALYQRHELEQAARAFETALQLQPTSEEAAEWLVRVREEQAYAQLSRTLPPSDGVAPTTAVEPWRDTRSARVKLDDQLSAAQQQLEDAQSRLTDSQSQQALKDDELARLQQAMTEDQRALAQLTQDHEALQRERQQATDELRRAQEAK
ncbi:MAG: tetratricopeptide repeat protein, partial [Candidatus Omnitrophica bacterium]|nr:tetratricopeptide repeat protein [Candidatus Omnitrophota bacterium]